VGNTSSMTEPSSSQWTKILSGYHYAYYLPNTAEVAWADRASGEYNKTVDVTLTAVSASANAKLVYTTDGSTPTTTNGTQVASGTKVTISSSSTLKVGLLTNGVVSKVMTRDYTIVNFNPTTATVYVRADWPTTYFYAWDDKGTLLGGWPGTTITDVTSVGGVTWYYRSFPINTSSYKFNIIFDKGSNTAQTIDITNISSDKYYVLSTTTDSNGKYTVADVSDTYTGITLPTYSNSNKIVKVYDAEGRLLRILPSGTSTKDATNGLSRGLYIVNDKKIAL